MYSSEYRSNTVAHVIEHANEYDIEAQLAFGRHINSVC